jgi:hypothetical protein
MNSFELLFTTSCDWKITTLGWMSGVAGRAEPDGLHKITAFRILFHRATSVWEVAMTSDGWPEALSSGSWLVVGIAWLLVSVPLLWGIWTTPAKAAVLFR